MLRDDRSEALAKGCADEFDTNARCVTSHDPMCTQEMAADCAPLHQAYEDCLRASSASN